MKVVGLTGGIGSGKTTVAMQFHALGVPVYIADLEAKKLMGASKIIKRKLSYLFGKDAYIDGTLNKKYIANIIFKDKEYLEKMNAIVHPKVRQHFKRWVGKQHAPYVIKEAAIIFENNNNKLYDYIITVVAPKHLKIDRLLQRDETSTDKIEAIMNNQWHDADKAALSDFVIQNIEIENTKSQVIKIHEQLLDKITNS